MVARDPRGPGLGAVTARRLFDAWRRFLGRSLARFHARRRRTAGGPNAVNAAGRSRWAADDRSLIGAGIALLVVGAGARTLLAPDAARMAELFAGSMTVALAFVRLAIMALSLPRAATRHLPLWRIWASGLVPYAVAVGPYTSMVAWAASAGLTLALLQREDASEVDARRTVVLAWGAHAAIGAAAWLIRNAAVAVLAG